MDLQLYTYMLVVSRIPLPSRYLPTRKSSPYFRELFQSRPGDRGTNTEELMLVDVEAGDPFVMDSDDSIVLNDRQVETVR